MSHLKDAQYIEIRELFVEMCQDYQSTCERVDATPEHIESVIALFYEPSDYWLWHPDTLLVDAIEDVVGFGIDELVGASA